MAHPVHKPRLTLDDYARIEASSRVRHEFYDGEIFAMAGGRRAHSAICANLIRALGNALDGKPCRPFTSDCRVLAPAEAGDQSDLYTYPDASVVCGEAEWVPPADTLVNPVAVAEVLSPSTEAYDRGGKFRMYRRIASLRTIVYISTDWQSVEVFEKGDDGVWGLHDTVGDVVDLRRLGVALSIEALYDGAEVGTDLPLPPDERA